MRELTRTRWAAIGAAVAVTIGAGGVSLTHAAISTGEKPVYVSLSQPCRVADTRPASTVGPKSDPLQAGEVNAYEIQITGGSGQCTAALAIPSDAVGISLNVTAIAPSAPTTGRSFFTVYPGDATLPGTSNLNFLNGQAPVANKVDVGLSATGTIKIVNNEGTAHAAVDIFGYYVDHKHSVSDITNEAGIAYSNDNTTESVGTTDEVVASVAIRPPSDGTVNVHASADWYTSTADRQLTCQITDGTSTIAAGQVIVRDTNPTGNALAQAISLEQAFPVTAYTGLIFTGRPFNLVCHSSSGTVNVANVHMTATFFASSYAPFILTL